MKAVVIINPASGNEEGKSYKEKIEKKFSSYFDEVEILFTEKGGDAEEFARKAAREKVDTVFVLGGDGTVNEGVKGLAEEEYRPKFGVFPGGTVNNLARVLGIPMDIDEAIEVLDFKKHKKIDIGKVEEEYFCYAVSIGAIPEAIHDVSGEEKTKWGPFAYLSNIIKNITGEKLYSLKIDHDGEILEGEYSHVFIALSDQIGDIEFAGTGHTISDGCLMMYLLKKTDIFEKAQALGEALKGSLEEDNRVKAVKCKIARVESAEGEEVEYDSDGDLGGKVPFTAEVLPHHLDAYYVDQS